MNAKLNPRLHILLAAFLVAGLAACANPLVPANGGSITVTIGNGMNSRTLVPAVDMNPANYLITGSGPGGETFSHPNSNSSATTISGLAPGSWTITAEARNASDIAIGAGSAIVDVENAQSVNVNITVRPFDGFGTLELHLNWPTADVENPSVAASLLPVTGSTRNLAFTVGSGSAAFSANDVATGYHTLTVKLINDGVFAMGAVEIVRIVKDQTTSGTFAFNQLNLEGGSLSVGITPEMDDPLLVSMAGISATKATDQAFNLTASVSNYSGNVTYVWYLNTDPIATGPSFVFDSSTPGYYNISVTAFSADGKRAGSTSGVVRVTNDISTVPTIQKIFTGYDETMIVKSNGTLWATGTNTDYRFGDGTLANRGTLTQVMSDVKSVGLGEKYTMILKNDDTLWAVGRSGNGEHGDGIPGTLKQYPVQVMSGVKAVSAGTQYGYNYTMILKTDGTLWGSGKNGLGQLGDGTTEDKITPVQVMTDVASVTAGAYNVMILKTDNSLWASGSGYSGQFGTGLENNYYFVPQMIMTGVAAVSSGDTHTMILKTDGSLWATGYNYYGQLGDGTTTNRGTPVQIMNGVQAVSARNNHTMILKTDGSLWATGDNSSGQLGDGTTIGKVAPVQVMTDVAKVETGGYQTTVLKTDGSLWAMGTFSNQFFNGNPYSSTVPMQIPAP